MIQNTREKENRSTNKLLYRKTKIERKGTTDNSNPLKSIRIIGKPIGETFHGHVQRVGTKNFNSSDRKRTIKHLEEIYKIYTLVIYKNDIHRRGKDSQKSNCLQKLTLHEVKQPEKEKLNKKTSTDGTTDVLVLL